MQHYRVFEIVPGRVCAYEVVGQNLSADNTLFLSFFPYALKRKFTLSDIIETTIHPEYVYAKCILLTPLGSEERWKTEVIQLGL